MAEAFVTPDLLTWARQRRGLEVEDLAKKLNVKPDAINAWEAGERRPTFRPAQNFAQASYVPFGYLYLADPPVQELPLPDLRTIPGQPPREPSLDLLALMSDVLGKQQWFLEYRESEGIEELPFVGSFGPTDPVTEVAGNIREVIDVDGARQRASNWEGFMRELTRNAEQSGIMIMRSGVVGRLGLTGTVDTTAPFGANVGTGDPGGARADAGGRGLQWPQSKPEGGTPHAHCRRPQRDLLRQVQGQNGVRGPEGGHHEEWPRRGPGHLRCLRRQEVPHRRRPPAVNAGPIVARIVSDAALDRISRNRVELVAAVESPLRRGVGIASLAPSESWLHPLGANPTEVERMMGEIVLRVIAWAAQAELESIKRRIEAGVRRAAEEGRFPGRPKALTPDQTAAIRLLRRNGQSQSAVARTFGVSRQTIWRAEQTEQTE